MRRTTEPRGAPGEIGRWVAALLRYGTLGAMALVGGGWAWSALAGQGPRGPRPVLTQIAQDGGDGVTALGLLALTLVPIVVVGAAALGLHRAGERARAFTAIGVGILLVASLVVAAVVTPSI